MSSIEAESVVEHQAEVFESMKGYLIKRWDEKRPEPEEFPHMR